MLSLRTTTDQLAYIKLIQKLITVMNETAADIGVFHSTSSGASYEYTYEEGMDKISKICDEIKKITTIK